MAEEQEYIALDEVASQLGVTKGTLHYYIRTLKIETKKFQLDRRAYMLVSDFETIKALKDRANRTDSAVKKRVEEEKKEKGAA
jgi:AcrR family transcriptional regulator